VAISRVWGAVKPRAKKPLNPHDDIVVVLMTITSYVEKSLHLLIRKLKDERSSIFAGLGEFSGRFKGWQSRESGAVELRGQKL
jgi:hypothetical protein